MALDANQLAQLQEWFRAQYDIKQSVDRIVEILLGTDFFAEPPIDFWKTLEKHGISKETFLQMPPDEQLDTLHKVCNIPRPIKPEDTQAGKLIAVLDVIFQERFGWPEGTVPNMTVGDVLLALEHATEWDNPSKPSIWDITK